MIRPFTVICCALAAGTVLYTYQAKHDVQLLDRQIEKTLADTASLREQSRALQAEWTLRENPERLHTFAEQYLTLKPVLPTQFTTLADLDSHLPAPEAMVATTTGTTDTTEEPAEVPVASAQPPATAPAPTTADGPDETVAAADELPIPPLPVPAPPVEIAAIVTSPAPRPASPRPPIAPAALPTAAPTWVPAPPIQAARVPSAPMQAQAVRPIPNQGPPIQAPPLLSQQRPAPAPMQQPPMQAGSLLAVGRGSSFAPVPRPIPVSETGWPNGR